MRNFLRFATDRQSSPNTEWTVSRLPAGTQPEVIFDGYVTIGGERIAVPPAPAEPKGATREQIRAAVREVLMERRARDPNY